ncbi:unnamed protein product [Lampetra fluviatilis]
MRNEQREGVGEKRQRLRAERNAHPARAALASLMQRGSQWSPRSIQDGLLRGSSIGTQAASGPQAASSYRYPLLAVHARGRQSRCAYSGLAFAATNSAFQKIIICEDAGDCGCSIHGDKESP